MVIFSPGLSVPRGVYTLLVEELAARGYVVVALDHTHDALAMEFPGGRVETGNPAQDLPTLRRALAVRVADVRFVLRRLRAFQRRGRLAGRLDLTRIGMVGHSLGGATAAGTMLVDRRVRAGILLDGTLHGAVVRRGLNRPFMIMNSAGVFEQDANRQAFWAHLRGHRFNFAVDGAGHYAFTDLVAPTPQFAPSIPPGRAAFMIRKISGARAVPARRRCPLVDDLTGPRQQADVDLLSTQIQSSVQHKDGPPRARSSMNTLSVPPRRPSSIAVRSRCLEHPSGDARSSREAAVAPASNGLVAVVQINVAFVRTSGAPLRCLPPVAGATSRNAAAVRHATRRPPVPFAVGGSDADFADFGS